ncbi:MAG: PAS domain-containing protein [Candidatus Methanocomedens sp.]|nr:MAG: PAS domain-containing protein [ANME-2 cluster archaeon]
MNKTIQDSPLLFMEKELRLISQDALLIFDTKGIIVDVNNTTVRIFGKNRDELIGTPFIDHFSDPVDANNAVEQVFDTGEVRDYELVIEMGDVPNTIVAFKMSLYKDQTGKVIGAFAAGYDISRHKCEMLEMHYLQHYNRGLIETSLDPLVTFDREGIILDVNEATILATGRGKEELIGTPFADYFTDPDNAYKGAMLTFETGEVRDYELVMKAKDGTETIVSYNASVYKDQIGKVVGAFAAARDITERKEAEQEIQNLQRYNRGLIETSLDPLVTFDQEGIILDVNVATMRATGRGKEELIGTPFADYFTDPDNAYKGAMLTFEIGEVRDYELVMKARDGTETIVAYNASVYKDQTGKVVGAFAAARDITEREEAEHEIQNLQRYTRGLIETSLDPLVTFDQEGIILDVNEATMRATGRGKEELIGTPFADYFTDPDNAYKGAMLTFETGEVRDYELVMKARDGTETIVSYNASVYKDQTGKVVGAFAAARDITEREEAEQEIQNLQRYTRGLIEVSLDPLVTFDQEGIILDVNEATILATGRGKEELIGTPFADYFTDPDNAYKGAMLTFETGKVRDYELVMKAKDGTETIVSYNASVYTDQTGEVVGVFAAARDITERRGAEQEIQNLQRYNRELIEVSLDPLVTFDQEGVIMDVNGATIRATGRTREELIGTPFADYFTDPDNAYKGAMLTFETGKVRDYELVMIAKDGTETIVSYNASVYKDQTGEVVGVFAAARDITERKQAEIALSESKAEVDLIFQIAANGMCVIDADFNVVKVNKSFTQMVDMDEDEIIGKKCYDVFSGELCHSEDCPLQKLRKGERFAEHESFKKRSDGKEIPVIVNAARLEKKGKFVGIVEDFKDITEHKQAEEEILDLQRYTRGLIEVSLDPLVTFDQEGIILDVNEATMRATGRGKEELIGTPFADYFTDPDNAYKGAMLTFEIGEVRDYELVMKARDGTETVVSYNASVYKDQTGKVVGAFAAARDITERKGAEQEIQNLQRYNRGLIETSLDPLVTFDQEGTILDVNEATIRATGRGRDELIGTPFADYFTDPDKAYKGAMLTFEAGEVRDYELVMKARDGTETTVAYNASVYKDQAGMVVGAFAAARDITERKKAEIALSESKAEIDLIFQIAADGMCVIDADSNIVKVNQSFIRMVGIDEDEIVGKKCYDIFSGGLCHSEDCPLEMMQKGELFAEHECVKTRPDGKEIPVIVNAARLEKNGKFIGIVEDFKDITERKQAEEEIHELQRYNRGLIEVNLDPLVTFDQEGIIMDVNTATIGATGRSRDELIGTPFADYFTDPEKAHKGAMKVFEIGEIRDYELVMKPKDEAQTTVAVNASVYMDQTGEVVGAFAASRDITLQKKAEHELQETVNRLEVYTTRINSLMVTMLDQITVEKTKGVILDISGLPPDEEVAEPLINIAKFARQLGATCIITGIKHEAVQRLTDAGANLAPITTEQSLLDGLRYTIAMIDEEE